MNKKILAICCIMSGILLYGCPPPKETITSEQGECGASNLHVDVNDKAMVVSWSNNCDKNIAGYNIYISEDENSETKPFNFAPFDGDTNPEDGIEHYDATNLENGKKYYVSVKIINPDNSLSSKSDEIIAVCGMREEIELSVRYKSDNDGYSFKNNSYVRADNLENDLYFFAKNGTDYIASPHKLDGFLRVNKLNKLSYKGDFQELRTKINSININKSEEKLTVSENDWILFKTKENTNALVKILGFSGSGEERKIKLFVAYSHIANELIF